MGDLIDSIGRNFQRLLRWVYPGALFLVLLRISSPDAFNHLACLNLGIGLWGLVVGGLVAGFVIYLFQGYFVSYIVTFIFIWAKWDVRQGLQVPAPKIREKCKCIPYCVLHFFDRMAVATRRRWNGSVPKGLGNYLDYAFAAYHAVMMTGWLTLVFVFVSIFNSDSVLRWWILFIPAILFLVGGIITYMLLGRIKPEEPWEDC